MSGIHPAAALSPAMETAVVPMAGAPVKNDLGNVVELCQGGVAGGDEPAPDDSLTLAWPPVTPLA
ncbi:MAG: hypothetical protein ACRERE_21650 [Candidatus Entotheonellia bacterium]